MPGPVPQRPSTYTVPCRCGTYHIVAVSAFGRPQTCKKCKSAYTVLWKRDPRNGAQTPIVAMSARKTLRPAKPAPNPASLIDVACSCGYRRKATADELRRIPTCPGCGNPMYVDRPARAKAPPAPMVPLRETSRYGLPPKASPTPPPLPPRATPPPTPVPTPSGATRRIAKIMLTCPMCGDRQMVQEEPGGRKVKCLRCDHGLTVPLKAPPVEAAVFEAPPPEPEPIPTPPAGSPKPPAVYVDGPTLACPCGADLDVRGASPGSVFTCGACGRTATMTKSRHPQSLMTVMKPVFAAPPEETLDVSHEPGALEILCECGEALLVSLRDVGHPVQCPGCSMLLEIQKSPSGLSVKPLGKIDEQSWSLTDFS